MGPYDIVGEHEDYGAVGDDVMDLVGDEEELDDLLMEGAGDTDIVGDDDLLLAGDEDLIGRRVRRRGGSRRRAIARRLAMRNAGAVVKTGLSARRRYPLGFVPTNIAAAASLQIPSAPQNLFRPERLVIPSDIAFDAGVRDIKVGNTSQLVQSVEVPAALFSEVAINTGVTFDTAEVGNQVSVDIRNKSGAQFEFSAGLVGTIAKK